MHQDILDLAGRIALVTGAGQGIGREVALRLARHNCGGVAVNDYVLDRAEAVAEEIRTTGCRAIAVQADVTDLSAVKAINSRIQDELGTVGILVNNAGNHGVHPTPASSGPFWETDRVEWDHVIGVNLFGVMNCAAAVVPGMIERGAAGRVVTIISDAARYGDAGLEVYAAAKAGAAGFSRSLARSLGRYGITVNCVSIGTTRTPYSEADYMDEQMLNKILSKYIVRRPGEAEDIANMVLYLASEASSWITGQTYPVNGGITLAL